MLVIRKDYFHNNVAKGFLYTKIVNKEEKSLEDEILERDVIEIYVPVSKKNRFTGAFEIYYDITEGIQQLHELKLRNYAISGSCSLLLFLIILFSLKNVSDSLQKIQHEISERERTEKEKNLIESKLHRAQKMEAIGLMAGGVAHDLNNILSGIVSYPSLLLAKTPKDSPSYEALTTIKEAGQRAAAVVEDLLTIARGVASKRTPANLNNVIDDYLSSIEYQKTASRFTDVSVLKKLEPELLSIQCSPIHINKVVMNLVTNAIEAIEGKGNVLVTTTNQYLDSSLKGYDTICVGEYVVLTITDNGPGISEKDLDRVFEPFYSSKVMGRSGTGLGLTVVWNTVHDHDGYINISSKDNETVFELFFPAIRLEPDEQEKRTPLNKYKGNGEKILVVDDEEQQRLIIQSLLKHLNYDVTIVASGEEALEYMQDHYADLLILDMIMAPGMNGRQTYDQIAQIHPGQKAIISSGYAENNEVQMVQKMGAGQYLKKPFIIDQLAKAVYEELHQNNDRDNLKEAS